MSLYDAPTLSNYNSGPPSDDGAQTSANQVKWATIKEKLTDPLSTYAQAIDTQASAAFSRYKKTYFVTDPDFGAVGDGVTDDRAAIMSAIQTTIANAPARLIFPTATYYCSDELAEFTGADDVEIDFCGSTLDFSNISFGVAGNSKQLLKLSGSYSGTPASLTADASVGDNSISCSTAAFSVGDVVRIYSTSMWDPDRTATRRGEFAIVEEITSGSAMKLSTPLKDDYATADSAAVQEVTPIQRVRIHNGTILAPPSKAVENLVEGVLLQLGIDCQIFNLAIYDCGMVHIRMIDCLLTTVRDCSIVRAYDDSSAYGVSCTDACQDVLVTHCKFRDVRHAFTTNNQPTTSYGITRRITVSHNHVFNSEVNIGGSSGDSMDTHAGAEEIYFLGNVLEGSIGQGINVEARSCTIIGNTVNGTTSHGIQVQPYCQVRAGEATISGNRLFSIGGWAASGGDLAANARGILVTPRQASLSGWLTSTAYVVGDQVTESGNRYYCLEAHTSGTFATDLAAGKWVQTQPTPDLEKVSITGNVITSKDEAIYVTATNRVIVDGNIAKLRVDDSMSNLGTNGLRIDQCDWVSVTDNHVIGELIGINFTSNTKGIVSGNTVELVYTGTNNVIGISSTTPHTVIMGNNIDLNGSTSGTSTGINLTAAADYSVVVGNILEDFATAAVADASTGSSVANNVTVP